MNGISTHTIAQPDSDTTVFILSCDRLELLDRTIKSYLRTEDCPTKKVIVDDSAKDGVFEHLVKQYGGMFDVICFPENRGQWWAMDFMVSFCGTEYVFYVEDDWEFLKGGYLEKSKSILRKHRDIGIVDISWRTFEEHGYECYDRTLIDDSFFHKKEWRISPNHLYWYGWTGSPNLKRRDDLLLLGRVEKWHNEWNIDRRFLALGLKSVFLNSRYVVHTGDNDSRMKDRRPPDGATPNSYYPAELKVNKIIPELDYYFLENRHR
jgi:glycosyltransferase involved in cell wall biosynthesis